MQNNLESRQFRLIRRPNGLPAQDDFELTTETLDAPGDGEVAVAVEYISLDPAMRGWMAEGKSYIEPVGIGDVMRAFAAGTVVASRHPDFAEGDRVTGLMGAQTHAVMPGTQVNKVDASQLDLPTYIGALGMPGMTAWFGILEVGELAEGDRVLVSAASGAVGALVGQIAKKKGATVVGIAGGAEKCAYLTDELGFDGAIDYKSEDVDRAIATHFPDGLDIFFDNVGGQILNAALANLRVGARVVICGAISQYNKTNGVGGAEDAPTNYLSLLVNRAKMEGFIILDYIHRYDEAYPQMAEWIVSGELAHKEDIDEGFDNFVETLRKLYTGENFGKLVLKV
ncbi:NADP-dependent oxidoreductase [Salinisphaera sp. Q1T1-3]|uniref:NADP-dependent oxidoreductase n=1 Tax=Salinisphaera sp. Q1T1-3 TaxID=2321229 RepID=UPI000E732791|nr:NADP-dependent oxidoreductase [Salinisphaera sp. Q1T1-3]RJS91934.1 NADP-dependent oxidoreductase [Salinisphaera sp. Q1T1-3]